MGKDQFELNLGGIVGYGDPGVTTKNCYNLGTISLEGGGNSFKYGGIMGYGISVILRDCHSKCEIHVAKDGSRWFDYWLWCG